MEKADLNAARTFAHQTIMAAMVMTHPDPARFADTLEQLIAHGQVERAQHGLALPAAVEAARSLYEEIRDIARMEAARRAQLR